MKAANPYLNFDGNTLEAFEFYRAVFGGELSPIMRYRDMGEGSGIPEAELDWVAHVSLPLGTSLLMGSDVPSVMPKVKMGTNYYVTLVPDSLEEAERVFTALAAGGSTEMALQETMWAERYGTCADRFGVQWMVNYAGNVVLGE